MDPRKLIKISSSFKEYLENHIAKLQNNWFMNKRLSIESYCLNPTDPGGNGSITKTNGIVITAHAYFNFMISSFNSVGEGNENKKDSYHFSYQIRIYDDPDFEGTIDRARLTTRTWKMNGVVAVDAQPGVVGHYPEVYKDMETFVYES